MDNKLYFYTVMGSPTTLGIDMKMDEEEKRWKPTNARIHV